ncbi:uncharacterized protein [Hemitrygon akajei]|uniref:uncharacterized protein n=1 Tax=Hemitrygon akajei TaxID=2704970 RepID=UPI003BF990EF
MGSMHLTEMDASRRNIFIFVFAAAQILYCSAQRCGNTNFQLIELVLNATIEKVNENSTISNLYAVTRCKVLNVTDFGERVAEVKLIFDVQETECAKNSSSNPAQCTLKPISDAETATCTGVVRLENEIVQNVNVQCMDTNVTTPAMPTSTPLDTTATKSASTPTILTTTVTSPITTVTRKTTPNTTWATPTRMTITTTTTTTTRRQPPSSSSSSSSSSEDSGSSEEFQKVFGWGRNRNCRRRPSWRRGKWRTKRLSHHQKRFSNRRQWNLNQFHLRRSNYATTTACKAEEI